MRLTQEVDYAFRIVSYLARFEGEVIGAPTIARHMVVPERFALRILRKLNLAGITKSKRGVDGGYILKVPKEEINLYDIILAVNGPIVINRCLAGEDSFCNRMEKGEYNSCPFHRRLAKIQSNIISDFKNAKITEFI
ncbi:MAG: Rrf2 family transcriptional regulator [Tissierellia bacterium]|nr:Rrf2 family transcriptional regulator [Tissierellia bacterium]